VTAHTSAVPAFRYRAFLSYSHRDETWARWLHKALEGYVVPRRLVGQRTPFGPVPRRLVPIFRDSDELATAGDLGGKVNEALAESASLLVVCSPNAASSHWVNEEVAAFKRLGREDRICCLIVSGEPNASQMPAREAEECFAPALRQRSGQTVEPIAADVRPGKDTRAEATCRLVAGMLGLDLDALKRRDYQRRARRAMILSGVAVCITAITGALAVAALVARNDAERRQKEAEDLVAFMLGDLNDKLAQVSRLDIMEAVDDKAMAYFEARSGEAMGPRALEQRVAALENIGSVRLDQGKLAAAMTSYRAALPLAERLAAITPSTERVLAHAELQSYIGLVYWRQGNLGAAQDSFVSANTMLDRVRSPGGSDHAVTFQRAVFDNNIGNVMEARGNLEGADVQYRKSLDAVRHIVAAQPGNVEWNEWLGTAYNNLGRLALLRGNLSDALTKYTEDERIQVRLAAADPKDMSRQTRVLTAHAIVGRTQALIGDLASGMERLQRALDIAAPMALVDASNADLQELVALYGTQLARLRRLDGDLLAATRLATKAELTFTRLIRMDPNNTAWKREYAETLIERAEQSRAIDDVAAARKQAQAAAHELAPLFAQSPDDQATLLAMAAGWMAQANVATDEATARGLREKALLALASGKRAGDDPRLLALKTEALLALGRKREATPTIERLWATGYRDSALLSVLSAQEIDYPPNENFQRQLMATDGGAGGR
jgi:tetratricopeptide (TPR) repeat protein